VGKAGFKLDNRKTDLQKKTCGTPCVEKKLDVNIPSAYSQGPHTSAQMPKSDSTPDSPKQLRTKKLDIIMTAVYHKFTYNKEPFA
jgi:hypothetical protein